MVPDRLLVIEDDDAFGQLLVDYLETGGYAVSRARSATEGMEMLARLRPALVLLDLTLPDEDGLVVLRRLRQMGGVPVAIVSGRDDRENRIAGLELGADDFIPKPFVGRELMARVANILRRSRGTAAAKPELEVDGLTFRLGENQIVGRDGTRITLTPAEKAVLQALANAAGRTLSREQLMDAGGSLETSESTRSIDIIVSRLRAKLERNRKEPALILTVQGAGYRLNV